jgi:hypothetical protein
MKFHVCTYNKVATGTKKTKQRMTSCTAKKQKKMMSLSNMKELVGSLEFVRVLGDSHLLKITLNMDVSDTPKTVSKSRKVE